MNIMRLIYSAVISRYNLAGSLPTINAQFGKDGGLLLVEFLERSST